MKIAIIDDEQVWVDQIGIKVKQFVEEANVEIEGIDTYADGQAFLDVNKEYHIVIMDIQLQSDMKKSGLEIAENYCKTHGETILIYITSHEELWKYGYKTKAFRYCVKGEEDEFKEAILSAFCKLKENEVEIQIEVVGGQNVSLLINKINYIEVIKHITEIHTKKEIIRAKDSLEKILTRLPKEGFYQIHRSYVVNFDAVMDIHREECILFGGKVLPTSRRKYQDAQIAFLKWKLR